MASIELRAIEKWFDDLQVIKGVDFDIKEGEFIVLVGPSGCGKTSVAMTLFQLQPDVQKDLGIEPDYSKKSLETIVL